MPTSSIETQDLDRRFGGGTIDLEDLAVRVFFAWNDRSQRLFIAFESIDDFLSQGDQHDSAVFMVDGDHSGGKYFFEDEEAALHNQSQAQSYRIPIAPGSDSSAVELSGTDATWAVAVPWTDVGRHGEGGGPALRGAELMITPWDHLVPDGPSSSVRTKLAAGSIIGIQINFVDIDESGLIEGIYSVGRDLGGASDASLMADAVLIPCHVGDCGSSVPDGTVVQPGSWARIKAGLGWELRARVEDTAN